MINIYLSRHARRQMKWRDVSEAEVEEVMRRPEVTEDSVKGRKNAFKHLGGKWLKVTFIEEPDRIVVVTVVDRNR
ncbi:MAG: DUF4258 domain-containing protein [Nitrospirae bacterium]|nr:DUF4258 domain-containing protein [Nitrospirota bacterium]